MDAGIGLARGGNRNQSREACRSRCRDATHGARAVAGALDHLQEPARGVSEIAGSQPPKNSLPGFGGPRTENPAGCNQRLLRFAARGFSGTADRQTARHPGRIQRELRTLGAAGFHVPELFRAGKRQTGFATPRERLARLPGRAFEALVGSISAQGRAVGSEHRSFDPDIPLRLSEGPAGCGESARQCAQAHSEWWDGHDDGGTAFLGAPRGNHGSRGRAAKISSAETKQRGSQREGLRRGHPGRAPSGNFRGFRESGQKYFRNGTGAGNRKTPHSSASRKDLGGKRSWRRKPIYISSAHGSRITPKDLCKNCKKGKS